MNHQEIEQLNIAERYVAGKLSPEELGAFEAHFIDCRRCLDDIEAIESFRIGLRRVAAEEAVRVQTAVRLGILARMQKIRLRQVALAVVALAAFALPVLLILTRQAPTKGSGPLTAQQSGPSNAEEKLRLELNDERAKWEKDRADLEGKLADAAKAQTPAPALSQPLLIPLNAERGESQTVPEVKLAQKSGAVFLVLEFDSDPDIANYRARIADARGRVIWKSEHLKPATRESFIIPVDAGLLVSGTYTMTLEGKTADGRVVPVKGYTFKIRAPK